MGNSISIRHSFGGTTFFKLFLILGLIVISCVFIYYTVDVIGQLKAEAEKSVRSYVKLWQLAASEDTSTGEVQIIFEEIITKASFPVIIADTAGNPVFWRNIPNISDNDPDLAVQDKIKKLAIDMKDANGAIPLMYGNRVISYFYYGDSKIIRQLKWMPFVELGLVGAFILVGFIGFQNIRRSEERHIWVGMAKETAHQLGTPISSLMGWLELLSHSDGAGQGGASGDKPDYPEIFKQMSTDVDRLQRVANRFGQIGSLPELKDGDLNELLQVTAEYYRRRLPFDGKGTEIVCNLNPLPKVSLNGQLVAWAIENLLKNALQAVDPQNGRIEIFSGPSKDNKYAVVEISDNGKGISPGTARKLFRPGFTTKKRGWGLGLTLSRRIVEEYHRGRIALLRSKPGETTFQIVLPVDKGDRVKRNKLYNVPQPRGRM